jgi:vacuolar protein sorting-associated protein 11
VSYTLQRVAEINFVDQLSRLQEKPTTTKLDTLFQKSLYVLAINLARTQSLDEASIADIHRRYGDHLYLKGDYDGAMQQFIKTLGHLQPSYVIRKVLFMVVLYNTVMVHPLRL